MDARDYMLLERDVRRVVRTALEPSVPGMGDLGADVVAERITKALLDQLLEEMVGDLVDRVNELQVEEFEVIP